MITVKTTPKRAAKAAAAGEVVVLSTEEALYAQLGFGLWTNLDIRYIKGAEKMVLCVVKHNFHPPITFSNTAPTTVDWWRSCLAAKSPYSIAMGGAAWLSVASFFSPTGECVLREKPFGPWPCKGPRKWTCLNLFTHVRLLKEDLYD